MRAIPRAAPPDPRPPPARRAPDATRRPGRDAARRVRSISWSHLSAARGQRAHGHVNAKPQAAVRALFLARGYVEERNTTRHLRRCAKFPYLRSNIMFFRRGAGAGAAAPGAAEARRRR